MTSSSDHLRALRDWASSRVWLVKNDGRDWEGASVRRFCYVSYRYSVVRSIACSALFAYLLLVLQGWPRAHSPLSIAG